MLFAGDTANGAALVVGLGFGVVGADCAKTEALAPSAIKPPIAAAEMETVFLGAAICIFMM